MAEKSKELLISEIEFYIKNNTTRFITPEILRNRLVDIVDSCYGTGGVDQEVIDYIQTQIDSITGSVVTVSISGDEFINVVDNGIGSFQVSLLPLSGTDITVDSTNFSNNLSPSDDTLQKALNTLDTLVIGSSSVELSASSIFDLADVSGNPSNLEFLVWNSGSQQFVPASVNISGAANAINVSRNSTNWTVSIAPSSNGYGVRYVSGAAPSGGNEGDIWMRIGGTIVESMSASQIIVNTTNFSNNLSSADDTLQKALDTLDDLIASGSGASSASEMAVDTTNFSGNLSSADNTVQKALDTIDDLVLSGNGAAATNVIAEVTLDGTSNQFNVSLNNLTEFDFEMFTPPASAAKSVRLFINGDITETNYRNQYISSEDSTVSGIESDTAYAGRFDVLYGSSNIGKVRVFNNTLTASIHSISHVTSSQTIYQVISVTKETPTTGVTTFSYRTSDGTNFPNGTKLVIKASRTQISASASVIIRDVNTATDTVDINLPSGWKNVEVITLLRNDNTTTAATINFFINNDIVPTNYHMQIVGAQNAGAISTAESNHAGFGTINALQSSYICGKYACGPERMLSLFEKSEYDSPTDIANFRYSNAYMGTNPSSITSLNIRGWTNAISTTPVSNSIGVGSKIIVRNLEAAEAIPSDTYSTSETATNKTWIDGKTIYRKVVSIGAGPNATTKTVAHGITGLDKMILCHITADDGTYQYSQMYGTSGAGTTRVAYVTDTYVAVQSTGDDSTYTMYAILEYTKV